jgi:putative oxidoreductase
MLPRLMSLLRSLAIALQPVAALLTRLVIGWTFIGTGLGKWKNFDHTVEFFRGIGIPAPSANAAFIATLELVGGICLILGLGTRAFAALLSCTMVVAIMTADWNDFKGAFGGGQKDLLDVTPVPFLMFLLWLVAFGAGAISVDRWLANRKASGASN